MIEEHAEIGVFALSRALKEFRDYIIFPREISSLREIYTKAKVKDRRTPLWINKTYTFSKNFLKEFDERSNKLSMKTLLYLIWILWFKYFIPG